MCLLQLTSDSGITRRKSTVSLMKRFDSDRATSPEKPKTELDRSFFELIFETVICKHANLPLITNNSSREFKTGSEKLKVK